MRNVLLKIINVKILGINLYLTAKFVPDLGLRDLAFKTYENP